MNVLMIGAGKGSWEMRGRQLGNAIGARTSEAPTPADWKWADVAVLIKRYGAKHAAEAHAAGVPFVWDAVDFWSQPYENTFDETRATAHLRAQIAAIRPTVTICATQAMADACGGVYLPHHSWRGLLPQRPREHVKLVTYQGNPVYLGQWRTVVLYACQKRGWSFALAPDSVGGEPIWQSDILVAFRDGPWDGWMCREWKSGVKIVNAQAAGRPIVTQPSAAMREIGAAGWEVTTTDALGHAFDQLTTRHARELAYETCLRHAQAYRLPAVAEQFRGILSRVVRAEPCVA